MKWAAKLICRIVGHKMQWRRIQYDKYLFGRDSPILITKMSGTCLRCGHTRTGLGPWTKLPNPAPHPYLHKFVRDNIHEETR